MDDRREISVTNSLAGQGDNEGFAPMTINIGR